MVATASQTALGSRPQRIFPLWGINLSMGRENIHQGTTLAFPVPVPESGLFSHKCTGDVLSVLVDSPHASFGIRDLSRATDHPHRSISAAVEDLAAVGFVDVEHEGPKKLVSIDTDRLDEPEDPILRIPQSEFHAPVRELADRLRAGLDDVEGIVLFGSVAQGTADRRSDVDCFVLVDGGQATAQQTADEITATLGEASFDGDRYSFHVLVESVESARGYGERLEDVFASGLTLEDSETLTELKSTVLTDGR